MFQRWAELPYKQLTHVQFPAGGNSWYLSCSYSVTSLAFFRGCDGGGRGARRASTGTEPVYFLSTACFVQVVNFILWLEMVTNRLQAILLYYIQPKYQVRICPTFNSRDWGRRHDPLLFERGFPKDNYITKWTTAELFFKDSAELVH